MDLDAALAELARDPAAACDAAEIALAVARDEYPELCIETELARLESWADEIRPRLRGPLGRRVAVLSAFLFDELRLRGNLVDYYEAENSYLNRVIDRRVGIPITLSIVAMAVGQRAGLIVDGVGLPGHFIATARDRDGQVMFDPFHGGQVLDRVDCEALVQRVTGAPFTATAEALRPIAPGPLVRRLLTNLKGAYLRTQDFARAARIIGRIRQLAPDDATEGRDLGVCLLQAGRPGPAIDLLESYLDQAQPGPDVDQVERLLRRARSELAKWN